MPVVVECVVEELAVRDEVNSVDEDGADLAVDNVRPPAVLVLLCVFGLQIVKANMCLVGSVNVDRREDVMLFVCHRLVGDIDLRRVGEEVLTIADGPGENLRERVVARVCAVIEARRPVVDDGTGGDDVALFVVVLGREVLVAAVLAVAEMVDVAPSVFCAFVDSFGGVYVSFANE